MRFRTRDYMTMIAGLMFGGTLLGAAYSQGVPNSGIGGIPNSTPGSRIWQASGAPTISVGSSGDMAIDTVSANVYQKAADTWVGPTMNLTGPQGPQGAQGNVGPAGANAFGTPATKSLTFATAIQATDPTRPAVISAMIEAAYTITLANTQADEVELRIGPVQATVANGTGGTAVATFKASLTGIALTVGMAQISRNQLTAHLPIGWFYAVRRVSGTAATIQGAYDQSMG